MPWSNVVWWMIWFALKKEAWKTKIRGRRRKKPKMYWSDVQDPWQYEMRAIIEPLGSEESRWMIYLKKIKLNWFRWTRNLLVHLCPQIAWRQVISIEELVMQGRQGQELERTLFQFLCVSFSNSPSRSNQPTRQFRAFLVDFCCKLGCRKTLTSLWNAASARISYHFRSTRASMDGSWGKLHRLCNNSLHRP